MRTNNFGISPLNFYLSLYCNFSLIQSLAIREIAGRYKDSYIGIFWAFISPALLLYVYTYVFGVIFKSRWGGGAESQVEFAIILFIGMIIFNIFSECVGAASSFITSHVNYVKRVIFPLEIFPYVKLYVAIFNASISLIIWFVVYISYYGLPSPLVFLLPVILLPLLLLILGLSWILASLGVYFRDISQLVGVGITALMFFSPVFYPITSLPSDIQDLMAYSPIAIAIEQSRQVLFWSTVPNLITCFWQGIMCLCFAFIGYIWFQKTRKGFSDVL